MRVFPRCFFNNLLMLLLLLCNTLPVLAKGETAKLVPPIVYAARYYTTKELTVGSYAHLYLINPDGTGRKQITFARTNDYEPHWSEDGRFIYFHRLRKALPKEAYGATRVQEYWSYDTKTGKEQPMSYRPPIRGQYRPPMTLAMEQTIAKRFPGKKLSVYNVLRFPDGEQACYIQLDSEKTYRIALTKPSHERSLLILVFDTHAKVIRQIRLTRPNVQVVGRVPKTRELILYSENGFYITDRNGTLSRLGVPIRAKVIATAPQFVQSPDGNRFVAITSQGNYAFLSPPDSNGRRKLALWDGKGIKPRTTSSSDFFSPVSRLLVGSIDANAGGKARSLVFGLVDISSCDWRGGTDLQ